ncbi:MAG TPA: hypothetical protein VGR22_03545 [Thermomicrobiales bacterium]|nr:hypothetical protein [Thermomicrobiales bacterium]
MIDESTRPPLDAISDAYVRLAFRMEPHIEGLIDAYNGPVTMKEHAEASPATPAELVREADVLLERIATDEELAPSRVDYLTAQVTALATLARKLTGKEIAYVDEVRQLFDVEAVRVPDDAYAAAITTLDEALPSEGPVPARLQRWKTQFELTTEQARLAVETILDEVRTRTAKMVSLPEGEAVEIAFVSDKPWNGYNWYLGDARSLVEINTDLPIRANALLDLMTHEGYPGHHTEHALKEVRLYHEKGYGEHSIQLINTPECVISEGIATLAQSMIFGVEEGTRWQAEHVWGPFGIDADPAREARIIDAQWVLRSVGGNAALLMYQEGRPEEDVVRYLMEYGLATEEEARHRVQFIADPLWRPYIFTYHVGRDLLARWLDEAEVNGETRESRFMRLLEEQFTPGAIARDLG